MKNPVHHQVEFSEHLQQMVDKVIIQPSVSPGTTPMVLVMKEDEETQISVDY